MKTRTDLLNFLAEKYNLQRYLEIGVQDPAQNFDKIKCTYKVSVDPDPNARATFLMTSDQFFIWPIFNPELLGENKFDLVFIDGLHTAEQVKKDFENALKILSPNGFIVLHDCNPEKEEHTIVPRPTGRGHWNGDVYKFASTLEAKGKVTVDIDNGCMVVPYCEDWALNIPLWCDLWYNFSINREKALNLITWDEFIASHSHL